ncbi:MAG: DEAD/DEAH box helicase [Nitrososphaerales archaeon]
MDEAYLSFVESYDDGSLMTKGDLSEILAEQKLLRSVEEINEMIAVSSNSLGRDKENLPEPLRKSLYTKLDYVVQYRIIEAQEPRSGAEPDALGLESGIGKALKEFGISRFYRFQEQAVKSVLRGSNTVIVAPAGSGKTEAFCAPIVQSIYGQISNIPDGKRRQRVFAVLTYPTKSLARDQLPKLSRIAASVGLKVAVWDGDTSQREKNRILDQPPEIIVTNFDSLHYHLIYRTKLSLLLRNIKYFVIDEVHVYNGIFGTNVHFILGRLRRLVGDFQVVGASATIANPKEFFSDLIGEEAEVVMETEGKHGDIHFAMLFPTMRAHRTMVLDLLASLTKSAFKVLSFSNSHLGAELTAFYGKRMGIQLEVHRAGLSVTHRKRVEDEFRDGSLKSISTTPTLELGIDIGTVDAVVSDLVNVTRLIQRIGRAGRRGQESIAYLALRGEDPISQYYRQNPEEYFKDIEPCYIDPTNPIVARYHLLAAAMDRPLVESEFANFDEIKEELIGARLLIPQADKGVLFPDYREVRKQLQGYDLRGAGNSISIRLGNRRVGERSLPQALDELHPGAVYFLASSRYMSKSLDMKAGYAVLERIPYNYPYYTRALREEWPTVVEIHERRNAIGIEVAYCTLSIKKKVVGYVNVELGSDVNKGNRVYLEDPIEFEFVTKGIVFKAPGATKLIKETKAERREYVLASGFHACEHVIIEGTSMITGGASGDMGGISMDMSGYIFVYDGAPGGNGASRVLFDRLERAIERGSKILAECPCTNEDGCPRCTYSYRCGNNNEYLHKAAALEIYERMTRGQKTELGDLEILGRPLV